MWFCPEQVCRRAVHGRWIARGASFRVGGHVRGQPSWPSRHVASRRNKFEYFTVDVAAACVVRLTSSHNVYRKIINNYFCPLFRDPDPPRTLHDDAVDQPAPTSSFPTGSQPVVSRPSGSRTKPTACTSGIRSTASFHQDGKLTDEITISSVRMPTHGDSCCAGCRELNETLVNTRFLIIRLIMDFANAPDNKIIRNIWFSLFQSLRIEGATAHKEGCKGVYKDGPSGVQCSV